MRTDREALGNTERPWERHGALVWGIPMLFLGRLRDPGKDKGLGVGNSNAILGIVEKLIK